jgi:N-hydroxyarylamine O-acetyltransferase
MIADVGEYLERIGCSNVRASGADLLFAIHEAHLLHVPFENLSIHRGEPIELRTEWLFDKIVRRRRGGFCYELNGLFAELLLALGFEVERLEARVYKQDGELGIPFDHLCLRVGPFLCDVGFGECFVTPLLLEERGDQGGFRIEAVGEERDLWKGEQRQYRFALAPRRLEEFAEGCRYHQTSPDSPFTKKRVCSMLTKEGRVTLRDDRLIERSGDEVRETQIDAATWRRLLTERFGIPSEGWGKVGRLLR